MHLSDILIHGAGELRAEAVELYPAGSAPVTLLRLTGDRGLGNFHVSLFLGRSALDRGQRIADAINSIMSEAEQPSEQIAAE